MAGTMVHLVIAAEFAERFTKDCLNEKKNTITLKEGRYIRKYSKKGSIFRTEYDRGMFISGAMAPDAIMSEKNYTRDMKMHTHFRDGIPDAEFSEKNNLSLFQKRLVEFADQRLNGSYNNDNENEVYNCNFEFYLGYIIHIMTDELFMLTCRPVFFEEAMKAGLDVNTPEIFKTFSADTDAVDFRLASENRHSGYIKKVLENVKGYSVPGLISAEAIEKSRIWALNRYYYNRPALFDAKYLTYDEMKRFIKNTAEDLFFKAK